MPDRLSNADMVELTAWRRPLHARPELSDHEVQTAATILAMLRETGPDRVPTRGAVILMFQPAEETGAGALQVINDPAFAAVAPDYAFALHNMSGMPLGHVALAEGPVACASRSVTLALTGRTAHASQPETGLSPMPALSALGSPDGTPTSAADYTQVTVTHALMGAPAFGVAPGEARLFATLRTLTDSGMTRLVGTVETLARDIASADGLGIGYCDAFVTCRNDAEAVALVRQALEQLRLPRGPGILRMRASEDFGQFGHGAKAALFLLGAGRDAPDLHDADHDFPDALIGLGVTIYSAILGQIPPAD